MKNIKAGVRNRIKRNADWLHQNTDINLTLELRNLECIPRHIFSIGLMSFSQVANLVHQSIH